MYQRNKKLNKNNNSTPLTLYFKHSKLGTESLKFITLFISMLKLKMKKKATFF